MLRGPEDAFAVQVPAIDQRLYGGQRSLLRLRYLRYQTAVDGSSPYWHIVCTLPPDGSLSAEPQLVHGMQRISRPPSLAETVLDRLRADIVRGALGWRAAFGTRSGREARRLQDARA